MTQVIEDTYPYLPVYEAVAKESDNDDCQPYFDFITTLKEAKQTDYQSYKYRIDTDFPKIDKLVLRRPTCMPTIPEAVAHLKLLKAFGVLKENVLGCGNDPEKYQIKKWKVFITCAVRRFIIFVSALRDCYSDGSSSRELPFYELQKDASFNETMDLFLPPLDVVMVWHAFLLNPKTFYDVFTREEFIVFAKYPFPLDRLESCIDNESFEYNVSDEYKTNYTNLLKTFTDKANDLKYDVGTFSMHEELVVVYCPQCEVSLSKPIPMTTDRETGFADCQFKAKPQSKNRNIVLHNCYCEDIEELTHDELRKLQLYHDLHNSRPLPKTYKYFSPVLCNPKQSRDPGVASNKVKQAVMKRWSSSKPVYAITKDVDRGLGDYAQSNLICYTVPRGMVIGEDLVGCVLRQEIFTMKMNSMDWLHSPIVLQSVSESLIRYRRFFLMMTDNNLTHMVVPTLDIDLMWHTHQLWMYGYFKDCLSSSCHAVIDHDDKVEAGELDDGFLFASKEYKKRYNEDYSICYCRYCSSHRPEVKLLFWKSSLKSRKKLEREKFSLVTHPLFSLNEGLCHISTHNSIVLPHDAAISRRLESDLPWTKKHFHLQDPANYVVAPLVPAGALIFCKIPM